MRAPFWSRFFAYVTDTVILFILAVIVAIPFPKFYKFYESLDNRLIGSGTIVLLLYMGLMLSSLGNGQTLGCRILGIQVLRKDGQTMKIMQSFFRCVVLEGLFCGWVIINELFKQTEDIAPWVFLGQTLIILVSSLMIAFLPSKRGPHDFAAGTIVVLKKSV